MTKRTIRKQDKEFRLSAVKLFLTSGRSYDQVSAELGVPVGTLVTWVQGHKQDGAEAFPGKGHVKPSPLLLV